MKTHIEVAQKLDLIDSESRVIKLQKYLLAENYIGAFINNVADVRYLTGACGVEDSIAYELLITKDKVFIFVSPLEVGVLSKNISLTNYEVEVISRENPTLKIIENILSKEEGDKLLVDNLISASLFNKIKDLNNGLETIIDDDFLENMRIIKDNSEIQRIEEACEIAEISFQTTINWAKPLIEKNELSEREFAKYLDNQMFLNGADDISFATIIACEKNGASPHAGYSNDLIKKNELIVCDFGSTVQGYHSDMTRTISFGSPSDKAQKVWNLVIQSNKAGVESIKAGVKASYVDGVCREVLAKEDFDYSHTTGHGVGIDIHEMPAISAKSEAVLESNMIITVEPGIYIENEFGVRIEDTLLVTKEGSRSLTKFEKKLIY